MYMYIPGMLEKVAELRPGPQPIAMDENSQFRGAGCGCATTDRVAWKGDPPRPRQQRIWPGMMSESVSVSGGNTLLV